MDNRIIYRLSELMKEKNVRSLSVVQRITGLSRRTLDKLYHQHSNRMDHETILKLCKFFECELSDLMQVVNKEEYEKTIKKNSKTNESIVKGYVYFIRSEISGLVKIGKTNDINTRIKKLSKEHGPLELLGFIESEKAIKREKEIHEKFSELRVHGEWFSVCKVQLKENIADLLYLEDGQAS